MTHRAISGFGIPLRRLRTAAAVVTVCVMPLLGSCSGSDSGTTTTTEPGNDTVTQAVGAGGGTVVTPSGAAGVQIPAGTFSQQVMVTITRLPTPSSPGAGPLPTSLKQYGPYYDFTTSPQVAQFGDSARVGVCQVTDPSSAFYPPEPHDNLRLAHTAGNSIEILERVGVNDFLRCTNVSASTSTRTDRNGWYAALLAIRDNTIGLLRPASLYASHGGLGGKVKSFSPFGAVDAAVATAVFAQVTVGADHTCGLTSNGVAYCWGGNGFGQLGDGTTQGRLVPTLVSGGLSFVGITAGSSHTCGRTSTGAAYCWGNNSSSGAIGDGTKQDRYVPTPVTGGLNFVELTAGYIYTCGRTSAGTAYRWGTNGFGEIGDGTTQERLVPTPVGGGLSFIQLTAGTYHTCGLANTGAAYCWGDNLNGELGGGDWGYPFTKLVPTLVSGGLSFVGITASWSHTCGRTSTGAAYCWGGNGFGQLGDGTMQDRLVPTLVSGGLSFVGIKAGNDHSCASRSDGAAYCWGANYVGQLGNGTQSGDPLFGPGIPIPTAVSGNLIFTELTVGSGSYGHTCGRTSAGTVYCWGYNSAGQLGDGTQQTRLVPTPVKSP
jgi:alpha-tubulin suppressor-like RCC1 family protein